MSDYTVFLVYFFLLSLGWAGAAQDELLRHLFNAPEEVTNDDNQSASSVSSEISSGIIPSSDTIQMDDVPSGLASNASGDKVVIGLPYTTNGAAKIYKLVHDQTCSPNGSYCSRWVESSRIVPGLEYFGIHVAMNYNGDRIAVGTFDEEGVGAVRVYGNYACGNEECWEQVGERILGGSKVAMDTTGLQLAIRESGGNTKVYSLSSNCANNQSNCWLQAGNDMPGLYSPYIVYGNPLAFAHNGAVIAIGDAGREEVAVYSYKECTSNTFCWAEVGNKIKSDQKFDRFGQAVALNEASNRIIIGAPFHDMDEVPNRGIAKVYDLKSMNCSASDQCWVQIGQTITGDSQYDKLGYSVAMSSDGSIVAIASPYVDSSSTKNVGKVQFYELTGSGLKLNWNLIAERIFDDVDRKQRRGALHLAMNLDGDTVISADGDYPGRLTKYQLYPCEDSPRPFILNGRARMCSWVKQLPNKVAFRCSKKGISSHCPASCGQCNTHACKDSKKKFELWNGRIKSCNWVGQKESKIQQRCGKTGSGVARTCRETCGFCLSA